MKWFVVSFANQVSIKVRSFDIQQALVKGMEKGRLLDYRVISIYEE